MREQSSMKVWTIGKCLPTNVVRKDEKKEATFLQMYITLVSKSLPLEVNTPQEFLFLHFDDRNY